MRHKEVPFIEGEYLLEILGIEDKEMYQIIIDIYDNQLDYNNFFSLFCVMSFSKIDRIIRLLLSACGIHSNYCLGREAAELFFIKISETAMNNDQIKTFLNNNDELIKIKSLVSLIESTGELYKPFWQMRLSLVEHFFNERYFLNVTKRIMYYDNSVSILSNIPQEPCLFYLYRILILKEPPPYYTEYRDIETNPKDCEELFNLFILERRKKFGYSQRIGHFTPHHSYASETNTGSASPSSSTYLSTPHKISVKKSTMSFNRTCQHIPNVNIK